MAKVCVSLDMEVLQHPPNGPAGMRGETTTDGPERSGGLVYNLRNECLSEMKCFHELNWLWAMNTELNI